MDQIKTMMDQLSDLDDSQVSELQSAIIKEFETVEKEEPSLATVDAMTSLADMLDGVRNEVMRRETAAKELAQRAAEAANRVHGQDGEAADKSMDEENPDAAPADAEAPAAPVEEMPKEEVAAAPMEEEAPVADAPVAEEVAPEEEASIIAYCANGDLTYHIRLDSSLYFDKLCVSSRTHFKWSLFFLSVFLHSHNL